MNEEDKDKELFDKMYMCFIVVAKLLYPIIMVFALFLLAKGLIS